MAKVKLNFDVDERTEVPTFEEVSSVMPKIKKHKKKIAYVIAIIAITALFTGSGFAAYKYRSNLQNILTNGEGVPITGNAIGGITGFMTNNINYSSTKKFGIEIEEIEIDLESEEDALKSNLNTACSNEKTTLEANVKTTQKNQCAAEKSVLDLEISNLESQVKNLEDSADSWKRKYNLCDDDLNACGG